MRFAADAASLTADQRFRQLAALLATGLLRVGAARPSSAAADAHPALEKPGNSAAAGLELPSETSVTVQPG
jgi:hypothetical protein